MANTRAVTTLVGDYVRRELEVRYSVPFHRRDLQLAPGGTHEFSAVSDDDRIVASVKYSSGLTSGGRSPAAKIQGGVAELYFLSLVNAHRKLLVLTTPEFHTLFIARMNDKIAAGIDVVLIPLPADFQEQVAAIQQVASAEMSGPVAR